MTSALARLQAAMRSQHAFVIEQENHLVPPIVLANNAFSACVNDPLASHVPDIWADLAFQCLTVFYHQMISGRNAFWRGFGASAISPIDTLMIGLRNTTSQQEHGQQASVIHEHSP